MQNACFERPGLPVTEHPSRAPHRRYCIPVGLAGEQIHQSRFGIVTCPSGTATRNIPLNRQARAVRGARQGAVTHPGARATIRIRMEP